MTVLTCISETPDGVKHLGPIVVLSEGEHQTGLRVKLDQANTGVLFGYRERSESETKTVNNVKTPMDTISPIEKISFQFNKLWQDHPYTPLCKAHTGP